MDLSIDILYDVTYQNFVRINRMILNALSVTYTLIIVLVGISQNLKFFGLFTRGI